MNLKKAIELYKNRRKQALLDKLNLQYQYKYAFVGVGQHSLSTYYPILKILDVPLKYILTQKSAYGKQVATKFQNAKATFNFDEILLDEEVAGIFICSNPASHFDLTAKALRKNKHVFVEKPVCYSLDQLNRLIELCTTNCLVGLQKRYNSINAIIKRDFSKPFHYYTRYAIGNYPEGNPIYEIFIHPLDNLTFLFGEGTITYMKKMKNNAGLIYSIQIQHISGVHGTVELSTNHSWNSPVDILRLETPNEEVFISYPNYIESTTKEKNTFGIPLNKIFQKTHLKEYSL